MSTDRQVMLEEKIVGDSDAKGTELRSECNYLLILMYRVSGLPGTQRDRDTTSGAHEASAQVPHAREGQVDGLRDPHTTTGVPAAYSQKR